MSIVGNYEITPGDPLRTFLLLAFLQQLLIMNTEVSLIRDTSVPTGWCIKTLIEVHAAFFPLYRGSVVLALTLILAHYCHMFSSLETLSSKVQRF